MPPPPDAKQRSGSTSGGGAARKQAASPGTKGSIAEAASTTTAATAGQGNRKAQGAGSITNVAARQEPDSLVQRVAAAQAYPFVQDWFLAAAAAMDTERAEMKEKQQKPLESVGIPQAHQRILRDRETRGKVKGQMLTALAEIQQTRNYVAAVGERWLASFGEAGRAYLASLAELESTLRERRTKAEEWTRTGVREETEKQIERFAEKRTALAARAAEELARELHCREKEKARLRVAFESCLAEVRDVMGWYLQQSTSGADGRGSRAAASANRSGVPANERGREAGPEHRGEDGGLMEKRPAVAVADPSAERRQRELLGIVLPSILSAIAADSQEASDQHGGVDRAADTEEGRRRAKADALLTMLAHKYPDIVAAVLEAPSATATPAITQHTATAAGKTTSPACLPPLPGIARGGDGGTGLVHEEEALQRQILQHVAGRKARQAAARQAQRELAKAASLYQCVEEKGDAEDVKGPGRSAKPTPHADTAAAGADAGARGHGVGPQSATALGSPVQRVGRMARSVPASRDCGTPPRLPTIFDTPTSIPTPTPTAAAAAAMTSLASRAAQSTSKAARKKAKPSPAKRKQSGGDAEAGTSAGSTTTDSAVALRIAKSIHEVHVRLGVGGSDGEAELEKAAAAEERPSTAASRPSSSGAGGERAGHVSRLLPTASPASSQRVQPHPVPAVESPRPAAEAEAEAAAVKEHKRKTATTTTTTTAARTTADPDHRLPAYLKTPLRESVIAQPAHPSLFAGHAAFMAPPPPLPPPTTFSPLPEDDDDDDDESDDLAHRSSRTKQVALPAVGAVSQWTDSDGNDEKKLRQRLRELRGRSAAMLAENVALERERARLTASLASLGSPQQHQQQKRQIQGRAQHMPAHAPPLLKDRQGVGAEVVSPSPPSLTTATQNRSSARQPLQSTRTAASPLPVRGSGGHGEKEKVDWLAASVVAVAEEQREALEELQSELQSRQDELRRRRAKIEQVQGKISHFAALMERAKEYWRTNAATLRRARNAQEASVAVAHAMAESRRLSLSQSAGLLADGEGRQGKDGEAVCAPLGGSRVSGTMADVTAPPPPPPPAAVFYRSNEWREEEEERSIVGKPSPPPSALPSSSAGSLPIAAGTARQDTQNARRSSKDGHHYHYHHPREQEEQLSPSLERYTTLLSNMQIYPVITAQTTGGGGGGGGGRDAPWGSGEDDSLPLSPTPNARNDTSLQQQGLVNDDSDSTNGVDPSPALTPSPGGTEIAKSTGGDEGEPTTTIAQSPSSGHAQGSPTKLTWDTAAAEWERGRCKAPEEDVEPVKLLGIVRADEVAEFIYAVF